MITIERVRSYISPIKSHIQLILRHQIENEQINKKYGKLTDLYAKLVNDFEAIYSPDIYVDRDTWLYRIRFEDIVDETLLVNYINAKHVRGDLPPTREGSVYYFIDNSGDKPCTLVSSMYSSMVACENKGVVY